MKLGRNATGILMIILGLIVLVLPITGLIAFSVLSGFSLALLGIGLLIFAVRDMKTSMPLGIIEVILAIIALILGLAFIVNFELFSFLFGLLIYLAGIFLIIIGILGIFTAKSNRWSSITTLIIGLIYLILGSFIQDPFYFGILIGLWLLFVGIITLLGKD